MNCIECGRANLQPGTVRLSGDVRGKYYVVEMEGLKCPSCGYKTIEGSKMAEFGRLLADRYREDHGLLTSVEIRSLRKQLGMTQEEFASHVGVGVASVKRWEMGKIQDRRSNECIIRRTESELGEMHEWTTGATIIVNSAYGLVGGQVQGTGVPVSDFDYDVVIQPSRTNVALDQSGFTMDYGIVGTQSSHFWQPSASAFPGQAVWFANENMMSSQNENQRVLADDKDDPAGLRPAA